jgi:hypothetical protein
MGQTKTQTIVSASSSSLEGLRIAFTYTELIQTTTLLAGNNSIALYVHTIDGNPKLSYAIYNTVTKEVSNFDGTPITHLAFKSLGLIFDTSIVFGRGLISKTGIMKIPVANFCMNLLNQLATTYKNNANYYLYLTKPIRFHKVSYGIIKNGEHHYMRGGGGGPGSQTVEKAP